MNAGSTIVHSKNDHRRQATEVLHYCLTSLSLYAHGIGNMFVSRLSGRRNVCLLVMGMFASALWGCSGETQSYPLDQSLARTSVQKAMQAWIDGKTPKDLQPEITIGDSAWEKGEKLVSFEIVTDQETTDGSNLHIRVQRKFELDESSVTYIVGTSPVVTIFPQ